MKRKNISYLISLSVSIVLALAIGALVLALTGYSPARAYGEMLRGAFVGARHIGDTLEYAMVLCICALACIVGAKAGIFNVGGEGQLLLGAIVAAQIGVVMKGCSPWLAIPCAALGAMAMGAAYAFIPGILKVKLKVSEVITTIMLNTVAAYVCQYLAKGPWKNPNNNIVAGTGNLPRAFWLGKLTPGSNLSTAIFLSAIVAFFTWYAGTTGIKRKRNATGTWKFYAFSGYHHDGWWKRTGKYLSAGIAGTGTFDSGMRYGQR